MEQLLALLHSTRNEFRQYLIKKPYSFLYSVSEDRTGSKNENIKREQLIELIVHTNLITYEIRAWQLLNPDKYNNFNSKDLSKQIYPDKRLGHDFEGVLNDVASAFINKVSTLLSQGKSNEEIVNLLFPENIRKYVIKSVKEPLFPKVNNVLNSDFWSFILDYVLAEIIEISGRVAHDLKRKTIYEMDMEVAVTRDKDLLIFVKNVIN